MPTTMKTKKQGELYNPNFPKPYSVTVPSNIDVLVINPSGSKIWPVLISTEEHPGGFIKVKNFSPEGPHEYGTMENECFL